MDDEEKPRPIGRRAPPPIDRPLRGTVGLSLKAAPRIESALPSDDVEDWVSASDLALAVSERLGHHQFAVGSPDAHSRIAKRAAAGALRVRADSWLRDGVAQAECDIPMVFWRGSQVAYLGNWHMGDFEGRVEVGFNLWEKWEVIGATFAKVDAEKMGVKLSEEARAAPRGAVIAAAAPTLAPAEKKARRQQFANLLHTKGIVRRTLGLEVIKEHWSEKDGAVPTVQQIYDLLPVGKKGRPKKNAGE